MILVIWMTDVFDARIASAGACASTSAKIACFSGSFSGAASNTKAASRTAGPTVSKSSIFLSVRAISAASAPSSRKLSEIRAGADLSVSACGSVIATYCPARASVSAIPCPMSPAPMTAV